MAGSPVRLTAIEYCLLAELSANEVIHAMSTP